MALTAIQLSLLTILADRARAGLSRDFLSEMLWDVPPGTDVRPRMSQLLYALNRRLGDEIKLSFHHDLLVLEQGFLSSDLQEWERLVEEGRVLEAATLLGRGFAPRLSSGPTELLEEWIDTRQTELRARLRKRAAALWSEARDRGDWVTGAAASAALLELDPGDEGYLQQLIWAKAAQGRVAEARAAFQTFVERGRRRTGNPSWSPTQATADLLDRARALSAAHLRGERDRMSSGREIPLFGREDCLGALTRALRRTPPEFMQVLVVQGEAGAGKSRLVREALRAVLPHGATLLLASSSELEREIPLGPFHQFFHGPTGRKAVDRLKDPWQSVIWGIMPDLYPGTGAPPEPAPVREDGLTPRLFEALRQTLLQVTEEGPTVLVIDDVQWLDQSSAGALDFIRRRWDSGRLTVVLVHREGSRIPGSAVDRLLQDLSRGGTEVEWIRVGGLNEEAARQVASAASGRKLEQWELEEILNLSGGNPFFLTEIARNVGEAPPSTHHQIPIPPSVDRVLQQQIGTLSEGAQRVLMLMSISTEWMDPRGVGLMLGIDREPALGFLEELSAAGIVDWDRDRARLQHSLLKEAVYSSLSPARLGWLHGRFAQYLHSETEDPALGDLALHFHRAGLRGPSLHYSLAAAEEAEESGEIREAIQFLQMAFEDCSSEDQRTEIAFRMGTLMHHAGEYGDSIQTLSWAIPRLFEEDRLEEEVAARCTLADSMSLHKDVPLSQAMDQLISARILAKERRLTEHFLLSLDIELHILHRSEDIGGIRNLLRKVRDLDLGGGPLEESIRRTILTTEILYGSPPLALKAATEAYGLAKEAEQTRQLMRALGRYLMVYSYQGLLEGQEGQDRLQEAKRLASGAGDLDLRTFLRLNRGVWFLDSGRFDRAITEFQAVERILKHSKAPRLHVLMEYNFGEAYFQLKNYEAAARHFRRAEQYLEERVAPMIRTAVTAGAGLVALTLGDLAGARRRFESLPKDQDIEHFDPFMVAVFESRMYSKNGSRTKAEEVLLRRRSAVANRFVMGGIKIRMEHIDLLAKIDPTAALTEIADLEKDLSRLDLEQLLDRLERKRALVVERGGRQYEL